MADRFGPRSASRSTDYKVGNYARISQDVAQPGLGARLEAQGRGCLGAVKGLSAMA